MRRNATKVAAVVMSLAVTMTSVNLPTTAAAATKKVKLNKTKATLTVGKTTTLKVTKGGKAVKATFKSNKPKIAKVVKKSGKSTKIKALKKGTATITATYAKKKYKCKITVKAKKVVKPTTAPTVAPTAEPTLVPTTAPATDDAFATKKNVAKLELKLTNAYSDKHTDTVLVGTNANLQVTALDEDGKPVANAPITLTSKTIKESTFAKNKKYDPNRNLTLTTLTTDAEGHATFVYGLEKSKDEDGAIDAMRTDYVSSYKLTATAAGSNKQSDFTVKFAALQVKAEDDKNSKNDPLVDVVNTYDKKGDLKGLTDDGKVSTKSFNNGAVDEEREVNYVYKQKVSTDAIDNSVTFSTAAYLVLPEDEKVAIADNIEHVSGKKIDEYKNYKDLEISEVVSEVNASKLKYATVLFDKINISEYTTLQLDAYLVKDATAKDLFADDNIVDQEKKWDATKNDYITKYPIDTKTIKGNVDLNNYSWSIQLNGKSGYLAVKAKVVSKGQVNLDNNKGVVMNKIVGVYNKSIDNVAVSNEIADNVKVSWKIDNDVSYSIPEELKSGNVYVYNVLKNKLDSDGTKGYTYKYSVPAFPRTGNAIITVYNKKGDVFTYYSIPTENKYDKKNVNVLSSDTDKLYEISEAEAFGKVGEVKSSTDTRVTVASKTTGVTHVVGTLESTNEDVKLDAANSKVYSSVQWNPVSVNSDKTSVGYAFVGQNIKVTAQLKDVNGNDVNQTGKEINFKCKAEGKLSTSDVLTNSAEGTDRVKVISISNEGKTNAKGQVELTVAAEDVDQLIGLSASTNSDYKVSFTLNGKDTDSNYLDLYWFDLNLSYIDSAYDSKTTKTDKNQNPSQSAKVAPKVGANWSYGVQVEADFMKAVHSSIDEKEFKGELAGHKITGVTGVETKVYMEDGYQGTYATDVNSVSNVSKSNGDSTAIFKIIPDSVKTDAVVSFERKADGNKDVNAKAYYAGNGQTTVDRKFKLNIGWTQGDIANGQFILPTGRYVEQGKALVSYFKLVDKYGNAVTNGAVTVNVTDATISSVPTDVAPTYSDNNRTVTTKTDAKGRIRLVIPYAGEKSTIVTVSVDGTTYSQSYEWREVKPDNKFNYKDANYNPDKKQLILNFTNDVYAASITKDMLNNKAGDEGIKVNNSIEFWSNNVKKTFNAKDVTVSGKSVTITLPDTFNESIDNDSRFVVNLQTVTIDDVQYKISCAETGEVFADDSIEVLF